MEMQGKGAELGYQPYLTSPPVVRAAATERWRLGSSLSVIMGGEGQSRDI